MTFSAPICRTNANPKAAGINVRKISSSIRQLMSTRDANVVLGMFRRNCSVD